MSASRDWSGWDMVRCPSTDPVGDCEPTWVQAARDLEPKITNLPDLSACLETIMTTARDRQRHGAQIAYRIRAELVCCQVYEEVQRGTTSAGRIGGSHQLCYWGEAAARIAEDPSAWENDPVPS